MKTYTLFAGVNGAGKSTLYKLLDINFGLRINVDEIIRTKYNHDWQNPNAQMQAGRIAVKLLQNCLQGNVSFNQETTLTGLTIITNIQKAKTNGFNISLYYVGLESAELSVERVEIRKKAGGHGIPKEDLHRRYSNSFKNLEHILPLCDNVQVYDNSSNNPFDILNPLLIVKNNLDVKWNENKCPQYLKNVLQKYHEWLKLK